MKRIILLGLIMFILVLSGCASNSKLAAKVNGEPISLDEYTRAYENHLPSKENMSDDELQKEALWQLIEFELMVQDAPNQGINVSDAEVEKEYVSFTTQTGTNDPDLKDAIKKDLIINKLTKKIASNATPTDAELLEYYDINKENYGEPLYVVVRQLFLSANETNISENKVYAVILALENQSFCDAVAKYADEHKNCTTYALTKEQTTARFSEDVFYQKIQDITVLKGPNGIHFVQTVDKLDYQMPAFEEIKDVLYNGLSVQKSEIAISKYVKELNQSADIEIFLK